MTVHTYVHKVNYYETDKMGITHHSNYVRWMEEARLDFLSQAGLPYDKMEKDGIMIPVLSASCQYKYAVRFNDTVCIKMKLEEFNGLKFKISYLVTDKETGDIRLIAETAHFFVDNDFKPIRIKNAAPKVYDTFKSIIGVDLYE